MGRRTSHDSDDEVVVGSRRKRQKVNYAAIENNYDDLDDELGADDDGDSMRDEANLLAPQVEKKRTSPALKDEDESFNEEGDESDDVPAESSDGYESEFAKEQKRRAERQFISRDDDDDDDDAEYGYQPGKRKSRTRKSRNRASRSARSTSRRKNILPHHSDGDHNSGLDSEVDNTLEQELADLKGSSDMEDATPKARSLRQRTKEVNYTLPPPLPDNLDGLPERLPQPSPTRRRQANSGSAASIRRLFPTGGPFGGGDVTSIFGKNYGGLSNTPGNLLAGGADSDSSDDEIVAINGKRSSISAPTANGKGQKKKDIADTDPLGVDMNVDFSSIGGLDNYINQLKEMVALPLLYPEVYQRFGITPPRGVLFHGPPGTGKTLMARALAASCSTQGQKITFFMRKGADCLSKWVGEAERQLRLLFEEAKKQQPSIIFFDEIDGLAPVRSSKQEQIHASIVSTMLALMDGMDNRGQVIVIGATNRPDAVDPALRRPGRFDREFYFPLPDLKAREEILGIHTKKWDPPLDKRFLEKVSHLTKGYGGADLRALCTEAALNSIQRRYPQIYQSNDKLKIDPSTIHVAARDFMKALDKIIPSSARSTTSGSAPLPEHLAALLQDSMDVITEKLDKLVPRVKKLSALEESAFIDPSETDADGGFAKHELLKRLESSRIHRPRLLISGEPGNGQQYLGAAVLNHLEGFNVQSLDLGALFGDSTRSAENAIIQCFIEAKRHKPSIIFIPNIDIWYETVPESAKSTLAGLLRSTSSNERMLLLGVSDKPYDELEMGLKMLFENRDANLVKLSTPSDSQRKSFFRPLFDAIKMTPVDFMEDKQPRQLEILEKVEIAKKNAEENADDLKAFEKNDMKLKNTLKIKLSGLMDLFKNRYRKFKKPPIDDIYLIHLFEEPLPNETIPTYVKDGSMIVESATGRKFFNMDLDIIEERLWNGFYSEPKQFLKDIEMIYLDSVTLEDRDRLIKASEMFANAQVGVEEISTPEFIEACKALRKREERRVKEYEQKINVTKLVELPVTAEVLDPIDEEIIPHVDHDKDDQDIGPEPKADSDESVNDIVVNVTETTTAVMMIPERTVASITPDDYSSMSPCPKMVNGHELKVDSKQLKKLRSRLIFVTDGFTVELLELINAQIMDMLWEYKSTWERAELLIKIDDVISHMERGRAG